MYILFAISIFCFLALVLSATAIVRHVRSNRHHERVYANPFDDFSQHLFAAIEDQDSRRPRIPPQQTMRDILAKKSWNLPPDMITLRPDPELQLTYEQNTTEPLLATRKPPQSAHRNGLQRMDLVYFNEDLGDLTDPYQTPRLRANSRDSSISDRNF